VNLEGCSKVPRQFIPSGKWTKGRESGILKPSNYQNTNKRD